MFFSIIFFTCFEQAGSSLTLFAEFSTNRKFLGFTIPTSYFQSLNPLFIIVFAPIMSLVWAFLRGKYKEPSSIIKFTISLFLISFSFVLMTVAGYYSKESMVSPLWLVIAYFIMTVAELCISPIGLSLVSKLAPKQFLSLIMGSWFLTSFFGNLFAGFWGGEYDNFGPLMLFFALSIVAFISAVVLVFLIPKLKKFIGDV